MKKNHLSKLALTGLTSGLLISNSSFAEPLNLNIENSVNEQNILFAAGNRLSEKRCGGEGTCGGFHSKTPSKNGQKRYIAQSDKIVSPTSTQTNNVPSSTPKSTSSNTKINDSSTQNELQSQNEGYHLMTEGELLANLNAKSRALYESLDDEGKKLVLTVASQRCQNTNECKGLNACQTDKNDCAGKGNCKYTGKCAFADKNLVVKLVAKKMAEKRGKVTQD